MPSSSSMPKTGAKLPSLTPRQRPTFLATSGLFFSAFQKSLSTKNMAATVNTNDAGDASIKSTALRCFLKKKSISSSSLSPFATPPSRRGAIQRHYVFLVHGWLGNELEMAYLETAIHKAVAAKEKCPSNIVVHKTKYNKEKTTDGIANGGARLVDEMIDFISAEISSTPLPADETKQEHDISISVVGNSLGGLYARFALSLLPSTLSCPCGRINIHLNIFCTTATPHLGVASHTYLPIPRVAEKLIGNGLAATGRDLFCLTEEENEESLIYQMATHVKYLHPLSKFRKRIAYANAFGTDFQVPTETASFLCRNSNFLHWHKLEREIKVHELSKVSGTNEDGADGGKTKHEENAFIAVILETEKLEAPPLVTPVVDDGSNTSKNDLSKEDKLILNMSTQLDSLGWTKVFVDVRDGIPAPSIRNPFSDKTDARERIRTTLLERHDSFGDIAIQSSHDIKEDEQKRDGMNEKCRKYGKGESLNKNDSCIGVEEITMKRRRTKYDKLPLPSSNCSPHPHSSSRTTYIPIESREVTELVTKSDRLHFPLGHTVMVVNSKNEWYSRINSRGQPVMNSLAEGLVRDIVEE